MRKCNFAFNSAFKAFIFFTLIFNSFFTSAFYGQSSPSAPTVSSPSMPSAPSAPGISSPQMPTVTAPTITNGIYTPLTNSKSDSVSSDAEKTSGQEKSESVTQTSSATENKNLSSTLTASDISTLDSMGLLEQVVNSFSGKSDSSLDSSLYKISNLYSSDSTSQTNLKLQQVLAELENLKAENKSLQKQLDDVKKNYSYGEVKESSATSSQTSASVEKKNAGNAESKNPKQKVLRFSVNNYNILSTCRTIYISSTSDDGSFLLTGDRIYSSDKKNRKETFYIYFKPNEASSGISSYTVACAVGQDYLNEYSFLYQMSQRENLTAYRTGNLVTLRTNDENWQLEFLLDLGN